jgi:predicted DNA-binding protein (UPF0251 family)
MCRWEAMRAKIPVSKLTSVICQAWDIGLSISSLPELLGVSKPTFYKVLKLLRDNGFEMRLMPNIQALGYSAFLIKSLYIEKEAGYVFDLATLTKASLVYMETKAGSYMSADILRMIGVDFHGPLMVRYVICPSGEIFEARRVSSVKVSVEEIEVIRMVSESFLGIKDVSKRLGIAWQTVAGMLKNMKSKGILVGPLIYWRPHSHLIGIIIELERAPPKFLPMELSYNSSVVVMESVRDFTHLVLGVTTPSKLIRVMEEYNNIILKVYLSQTFPLPPFTSGNILGVPSDDFVRGQVMKPVSRIKGLNNKRTNYKL